jgi:hypothetical protein
MDRDVNDPRYIAWRASVVKRDGSRCQMTGCKRRGKEVHHIFSWASAPLLRFEVENGIHLCKQHHYQIRNHEETFIELFMHIIQSKKNPEKGV